MYNNFVGNNDVINMDEPMEYRSNWELASFILQI